MTLEFLSSEDARARGVLGPDVYYHPGYGAAVEASDGARWRVAVFEDGRVLMPYLERPVPAELGAPGRFDAVSPYGYAGPWSAEPSDELPSLAERFRAALLPAWRDQGCVAEFHRLSSFVPGAELARHCAGLEVLETSRTVMLPLSLGADALWTRSEGRSRTSVRKARKRGYEATFRPVTSDDLAAGAPFRSLYEGTMRAVGAAAYYLFPDAYYDALLAAGIPIHLASVRSSEGEVVSAALFFHQGELAHYHLSGSDRMAARDGVNNLMMDTAIHGLIELGVQRLHLGGGVRDGDPLFRFKVGFGGDVVPFRLARGVVDPDACSDLVSRRAAQLGVTVEALEAVSYFPPYRGTV